MADAKIINYGQQISAGTTAIPDNNATALDIESTDAKNYITIDTSDGAEVLSLEAGGSPGQRLFIKAGQTTFAASGLMSIQAEDATATNPVFCPNSLDTDTGIGRAASDRLSLIAGGTEALRLGGGGVIGKLETSLTGTFTATNGSAEITSGSSTAFTTQLHVGSAIELFEPTTPNPTSRGVFTVTAIDSGGAALTLDSTVSGLSSSPRAGMTGKTDGGELFAVKTGDSQTILAVNGSGAMTFGTKPGTEDSNIAIGDGDALDTITEGKSNIIIGHASDNFKLTTGKRNIFMGYRAGEDVVSNDNNVIIGFECAQAATNHSNVFIGAEAAKNSTGFESVAVGKGSMMNCTGDRNVAIGVQTLDASGDADNSVAIGFQALSAATGDNNVAIGHSAMSAFTGTDSVAIGKEALDASSSVYSTAVGYQSLTGLTGGSLESNSAFGYRSGDGLDTGQQCTFLGADADTTDVDGNNQIAIGYGAVCDAPNKIMMGNHRNTDMTMDCPPITVKQTSESGAGITLEHEGSTGTVAFLGENADGGWMQLNKAGTAEVKLICSGSSFVNSDSTRNFGVGLASPNSTLHVGGSLTHGFSTPSGNATAGAAVVYHCNTASNDVTITLPAKSGIAGRVYTFKKIHASNNMIIAADGSETIDGAASLTFGDIYDSVTIQCGTAGWYVLSKYQP